eukprot:CAMPEP_0114243042 /NCGR_PEP_ID=MMETSP0058-20121206/10554_1 /TAXON_ID=36894 /ORGANISM="Pyramimonas parkeae, CCMP726" /LENGTH=102 /DNA_ID=CAMNT_0001355807 /DNA_START=374 /DNA_END=682 /DNA_ORIENTATION=-
MLVSAPNGTGSSARTASLAAADLGELEDLPGKLFALPCTLKDPASLSCMLWNEEARLRLSCRELVPHDLSTDAGVSHESRPRALVNGHFTATAVPRYSALST